MFRVDRARVPPSQGSEREEHATAALRPERHEAPQRSPKPVRPKRSGLLPLLAWRLLLANLGVVRGIFLTNEKMLQHAMVTAVVAAALNLGLNAVLIPRWGATGCIIASLVSFTVNIIVLEFLDSRARTNLRVMLSAVTFRPLQI